MSLRIVITLIVGLVLGSFLGVFTHRIPIKRQYLRGRSSCPRCGAKIVWYDNIPVLSFLFLRGRCRSCKKKISLRYPLIEIGTALVLLALYFSFGFDLPLFIVSLLSISIFVIDLEKRIIPDELVFWGFLVTSIFLLLSPVNFYLHFFGGFLASFLLLTIHILTRGKGMGLGDVKYALFIGTYLGFPHSLVWLSIAFLTGAAVGSILVLTGKAKFGKAIAFGPFLAISFFLTLFFSDALLKWFLG